MVILDPGHDAPLDIESVDEQSAQLPGSAQAEFWDDLATEAFAKYRALTLEYLCNYSDPRTESSPSEWVSALSYSMDTYQVHG